MIKRTLYYTIKKHIKGREAIIVTGMRQVGKTTLLWQLFEDIESEHKTFLDLENPLNQKIFENDNYDAIARNLGDYGIRTQSHAFILLDEIQFSPRIPSFVKYCIDHYGWKFFLTGSSSFYLKNLFSESLAGRKFLFELFPFSFEEFLTLKGIRGSKPHEYEHISRSRFDFWHPFYEEYVHWGGFPAVIKRELQQEKKMVLRDIFSSYFNKEILQFGDFRNNRSVRDLMLLLLSRVGSHLDIQKLSKELGVARQTIKEHLSFLEGTYFISLIYPYTRNLDVEIRSTPKVYLCDTGLVSALAPVDFGHVFENMIFHQLRLHGAVNYYQKKSGPEIDFIVDKKYGYEVKEHAQNVHARHLATLAKELGMKKHKVVSFSFTANKGGMYGFQL